MTALLLLPIVVVAVMGALLWHSQRAHRSYQAPAVPAGRRRLLPAWPSQAGRLAAWLQTAAQSNEGWLPEGAAADLSAWASTRGEGELRRWERATRAFCAEAGLELRWLWDSDLAHDHDLFESLAEVVLLYTLSYSRAHRATLPAAAVKALRSWRASPNSGRGRRFGEQLHAALVRRNLVTVSPELYLAPERRRRAEATAAIRRLDTERHEQLRETVELMLSGMGEPRPRPAAAPTEQLPALDTQPA